MVSGVGHVFLYGNQWGPSSMLDGVQDGEYADQGSLWTAFDLRKSCVRQIENEKALCRNPVKPCSTPLSIQVGAWIRSSGTQYNSPDMIMCGLCRYSGVMASRFSATVLVVSTDPIDVSGEYANSLTAWFLEVAHYVDGSRWSQFLVRDVSTTELLCVAHWHVWHDLQSSSLFAAYRLSFLYRRWWSPSKLSFVEMKYFCYVQLTCDYRRSDAWFN